MVPLTRAAPCALRTRARLTVSPCPGVKARRARAAISAGSADVGPGDGDVGDDAQGMPDVVRQHLRVGQAAQAQFPMSPPGTCSAARLTPRAWPENRMAGVLPKPTVPRSVTRPPPAVPKATPGTVRVRPARRRRRGGP